MSLGSRQEMFIGVGVRNTDFGRNSVQLSFLAWFNKSKSKYITRDKYSRLFIAWVCLHKSKDKNEIKVREHKLPPANQQCVCIVLNVTCAMQVGNTFRHQRQRIEEHIEQSFKILGSVRIIFKGFLFSHHQRTKTNTEQTVWFNSR